MQRIGPDIEHWKAVLPRVTNFWRTCVLPEVLRRWYTRKHNTPKVSCLQIFSVPKKWYCPNCRTLPKFRQKGKSAQSARKSSTPYPALAMDAICICKSKPNESDKLVECHSSDCKCGNLSCIGLRRMPNNSKTTWICASCKGKKQQQTSSSRLSCANDITLVKVVKNNNIAIEKHKRIANLTQAEWDIIYFNHWMARLYHCPRRQCSFGKSKPPYKWLSKTNPWPYMAV